MTTCSAKREESVKTDTGAVSLNDREDAETADGQVTVDVKKMRCTCEGVRSKPAYRMQLKQNKGTGKVRPCQDPR